MSTDLSDSAAGGIRFLPKKLTRLPTGFIGLFKRFARFRINGTVSGYLALILLGVVTGLFSLLLGASFHGMAMFWSYFSSPLLVLLSLLPPVLLILLVYFISGRAWLAFPIPALLILALSAVNFFKLQLRSSPLLASDLFLAGEAGGVISGYKLTIDWRIYLTAAFFLIGTAFCIFVFKRRERGLVRRLSGAGAVLAAIALLYAFVYTSGAVYDAAASHRESTWSVTDNYIARGFVLPFLYSTRGAPPDIPDGYGDEDDIPPEETVDYDIPDDKKVNVISIMLEAYCDLSTFGVLNFTQDVYGPLHDLQAESVSGTLVDNVFAGGTIDTERLFLTGFSQLRTYDGDTNSFVHYLKSQGYSAEGLHAGDGWFYDRTTINRYLGFDNYYFLEDYADGSRDDSFFFPEVAALYAARDKSVPYFSYSLTYQNHGAYYDNWSQEPYYLNEEDMSVESFNILNNYLTGIADTTQRISDFVDSFRDDAEPVVIVIFGDHMPWLGNSEAVYRELGINADTGTEEGFYNLYSTPYIIWANDAAKQALGNDFKGDGGSFSPTFLMNKLFELCSWGGDEYMHALTELRGTIDVINSATGVFRENGKLTLTLSAEGLSAYNKFRRLEYYRQQNFVY